MRSLNIAYPIIWLNSILNTQLISYLHAVHIETYCLNFVGIHIGVIPLGL